MATQGTEKVLGGTPAKRYSDPYVTNRPNEYGLYQWSAFRATLCWFNESGTLAPLAEGSTMTGLLFVSDLPAILSFSGVTSGGLTISPGTGVNALGTSVLFSAPDTGSAYVVLPSFGKVASGYSGLNAQVYVTGFPIEGYAPGTNDLFIIDCIANSPNICAPIGNAWIVSTTPGTATPVGKGSTPILLQWEQYTQAIKDNDNIIEQGGYSYVVVGLFEPDI